MEEYSDELAKIKKKEREDNVKRMFNQLEEHGIINKQLNTEFEELSLKEFDNVRYCTDIPTTPLYVLRMQAEENERKRQEFSIVNLENFGMLQLASGRTENQIEALLEYERHEDTKHQLSKTIKAMEDEKSQLSDHRQKLEELRLVRILFEMSRPSSLIRSAITGGHFELVRVLIPYCDHIALNSALSEAVAKENLGIVTALLQAGADPNHDPERILNYALESNFIAIATELLSRGAIMNEHALESIFSNLNNTNAEQTEQLLRFGMKHGANVRSKQGGDALCSAAEIGYLNLVKLLVENGAYINHISTSIHDFSRAPPLYLACWAGHYKVARYLLEKGASPKEFINITGAPPLHQACKHVHKKAIACEVAVKLIEYGVPFNDTWAFFEHGELVYKTPILMALTHKFGDMVLTLVSLGGLNVQQHPESRGRAILESACKKDMRPFLFPEWSPATHLKYPSPVRKAIKCLLLIAKRENWMLGRDIMYKLFSYISFGWLHHRRW